MYQWLFPSHTSHNNRTRMKWTTLLPYETNYYMIAVIEVYNVTKFRILHQKQSILNRQN